MSCPTPDRVLDYLARRLAATELDELDAHVDRCSACRRLLVELARTDADEIIPIARERAPEQIGRYRIETRLGSGGMGTVYRAYDPQLDRRVALKLVHPELAKYGGLERLQREGRALARLAHPNVVGVYDAGTDDGRVYVAMELVEGDTLAHWLRERDRTWREIVDKFVAAGRGLAAAHHHGIIHRDVKPENVLVDRAGIAKVADFGLAGHSEPRPEAVSVTAPTGVDDRLTQPGAVMGTPAFMSPEQRRGDELGPATDQFSLCAALETALLERPRSGATKHTHVPRWVRRVIARGTSRDPADRYPSLEAMLGELDPGVRSRRARRLLVAGGIAVAACASAGVYLATRTPDPIGESCIAAADARARLWSGPDRTAIAAAFERTNVVYATETWKRVDAVARRYLAELDRTETATCDQRPQSDEAHALQVLALGCLADRRDQLAAMTTRLRVTTAADVRFAVARAHGLPSIADCSNLATLEAERAALATPLLAAARAEVRSAIDSARAAESAGSFREAAGHARRAVERARQFGGVILARALLTLAEVVPSTEGSGAAQMALREAMVAAEAGKDDVLRAYAMTRIMEALAREPGHEREALAQRPLVEAAIYRSGKRTELLPVVQQAVGIANLRLGNTTGAVEEFQAALASARAELPPSDPRLPDYIYQVGVALSHLRKPTEALAYHEEAARVANDVWGAGHPNTARFTINVAITHAAMGGCDKALVELAAARSILTGVLPPDANEHLMITQTMGACHYIRHDHDAALREYTARQRALLDAGHDKSVAMAASWVDVGDVQLERKDYAAALASYRRAVTEHEDLLGKTDARLGVPLSRVGEAELRAGHGLQAIAPLERALAIYKAAGVPAIVLADVQFPLARALWSRPEDRRTARELAVAARDAFAASGMAPRKDEVEAWLAKAK